MFIIYINNAQADTRGVSFTWTLNSPVADSEGKFKGDFVYNITLKNNKVNNKILKTPLRFSRIDKIGEFDVRCLHFGTQIFDGIGIIEDSNDENFQISVSTGSGRLAYMLSDRKLNEDFYDTYQISPFISSDLIIAHAQDVVLGNIVRPYQFPKLYAPDFYGSNNDEFGGDNGSGSVGKYLNNWDHDNQRFHKNIPVSSPWSQNIYSLLPAIKAPYILNHLFSKMGYTSSGKFFEEADFEKLLVVGNVPLDKGGEKKYFAKAESTQAQYINLPDITLQMDNILEDPDTCISNSQYQINSTGYYYFKGVLNYTATTKDIAASIWIRTIEEDNIKIHGFFIPKESTIDVEFDAVFYLDNSFLGKKIEFELMLDQNLNSYTCNGGWVMIQNMSMLKLNVFNNQIRIADHLPEMEATKFLSAIFFLTGTIPFIDDEKKDVRLISFDDIIQDSDYVEFSDGIIEGPFSTVNDTKGIKINMVPEGTSEEDYTSINQELYIGLFESFDDLPADAEAGQIAGIINQKAYYTLQFNDSSQEIEWGFLTNFSFEYETGEDPDEIDKGISTMLYQSDSETLYPHFLQKAFSTFFNATTDAKLQVLYYHGLQEDADGKLYPAAGMGAYGADGSKIGNNELSMVGEMGIIEKRLKRWINHRINTTPVKMKKVMTSRQVRDIKRWKKAPSIWN
jgi:hypothetical protein